MRYDALQEVIPLLILSGKENIASNKFFELSDNV